MSQPEDALPMPTTEVVLVVQGDASGAKLNQYLMMGCTVKHLSAAATQYQMRFVVVLEPPTPQPASFDPDRPLPSKRRQHFALRRMLMDAGQGSMSWHQAGTLAVTLLDAGAVAPMEVVERVEAGS